MAKVSITINNETYDIACADGEEQHILNLAGAVDAKVGELVAAIGQAGEARLLAMAGLLMADELAELNSEGPSAPPQPTSSVDEEQLAQALESMAVRIESIASELENA
ncbi:cell division protein ZapA [Magnetovibrio sp. PR-2]|uniref:cell division protein ZapA n=1 Tax=Magnetovibrio sp. PR-2 TaxID=3120356 RepID=UPI002FCE57F6